MAVTDRDTVATGPRTRVRVFSRAHVDAWQAWPDYEERLLVGTSPRRMPPDQRARWYDDITQRQHQIPFAVEDETGFMIGRIFLRHVRHEERSAVLGIDLHPAYLSKGYGTESLGAFLHHYFEGMAFERMLLSVAAHNVRARRCYESLGFTTVGSHWDAHVGPDVSGSPNYASVRHLFRRGPLGLESLFYDMRLEGAVWRKLCAQHTR
ncbi:MAG: GNAT family N-acetyltransferase [Chloroflexi bacterium]|nr:GNAT family N-acetyltransferase [Chloroflexota bacterium]